MSGNFTGGYRISRQYTTLQEWEDCISYDTPTSCSYFQVASGDLVADGRKEIGIAYNDSVGVDFNANVLIEGATTDANHDITLTADPGNRHHGIPDAGVHIKTPTGDTVQASDSYVTIEWLEVTGTVAASNTGILLSTNPGPGKQIIRFNLVHDTPLQGIRAADADINAEIYNNIVYNSGATCFDVSGAAATIQASLCG